MPVLVRRLSDSDLVERREVAETLLRIAPDSVPLVVQVLVAVVTNPQARTTTTALHDPLDVVAVETLASIGADAAPVLRDTFRTSDRQVRTAIASGLQPAGPEFLPILVEGLQDEDSEVRREAAHSHEGFKRGDTTAHEALVALEARLGNDDLSVQAAAAAALAKIEPENSYVLGVLIQAAKHGDEKVRLDALHGLKAVGPRAAAAVPFLVGLLNEPGLQWSVVEAIGHIGPSAAPAIPHLVELLCDPTRKVPRGDVGRALFGMGKVGLPFVVKMLQDPDVGTRRETIQAHVWVAWCDWPDQTRELVPTLVEALNDQDVVVRYHVAAALGAIGPEAARAVPVLCELIKDRDLALRSQAAEALARIARG